MVSRTLLALTAVIAVVLPAVADDKKVPDEKAIMEAMIRHATPGPHHAILEQMAGTWSFTGECWMQPDAPPQTMTGTCERKMILGGRFIQDHVQAQFSGQPFEGIGITGYDNHTKKYTGIWMDSMSTSTAHSTGTYDEKTRTLTSVGESYNPMRQCNIRSRDVVRFVSPDEQVMEMYQTVDGKEFKAMAIKFTRKK